MDNINIELRSYTIILLITTLSFIAGSNINCNGKAFHCVNSTHFKICVDLGHGVSMTVDEFLIPCPQNTVCKQYNLFECEYELTTTLPPVKIQSEVTNENLKSIDSSVLEQLDIKTLLPTKQQDGMELSEKYYNKINATPASFTESFLTDAVIDSVNTGNANDLHTSSKIDINKTLNISLSTDKVLTSITKSGIDVPRSFYNINTLVTDTGVTSKYNTETPVFFSTTQDRRTIDSFKMESVKPFNQNNLDLDATYTVTKRTDKVSSVSEWRYSAVTLFPGNFSDPSLQENTPRKSNINHLIKSDNSSQDNLDILFKYNTTQLNNSDNNTQYRNIKKSMYSKNTITDINTLNSTPFNVTKDKIFTSGVSDINRKSKVNSDIMLKPSGQNLAEITTTSTIIVPGFSSHISLNTEVIETFLNDGLNITTNLENLSISDGDIISSIILDKKNATYSNKPTTSDTKPSKLRSDSEILNLKDEFEVNFTTELNSVNNSQYLTTTDQYFHQRSNIPITSTLKSEVTAPININKVSPLRSKVASQVDNALQINDVNTIESKLVSTNTPEIQSNLSFLSRPNFSLFTVAATKTATNDKIIVGDYNFTSVDMLPVLTTAEMSNGATSSKPLPYLITKNKPLPETVIVIGGTDLDNNNITNTEESNNITGEISKRVTSLKPISGLISKNETQSNSVMVTVATDLDNKNITITEGSNNITEETSNGVSSLKPTSDLISKNKTRPKSGLVTLAKDLDTKNVTTTEGSSNITAELSKGVTSLKPITDLISKNETRPKPVMVTVATGLSNKNITTTEGSTNITAETSNGVLSLKPTSDLISKNETRPKPVMVTIAIDLDNNNIAITEENNNMTAELPNGVTSFKSISDLISKNETRLKPIMVTVGTDLGNKNVTTTEGSSNITAELSKGVTSLKLISDLISKNETRLKPVMVTVGTELGNKNVTTTKGSSNITAETSNAGSSLKPTSDSKSNNETRPKPVMVTVGTDLGNKNVTTTEGSSNITAELSKGVTSLKLISDLISKNETRPKPVTVTVATDLGNNNVTTTEGSTNITAELSKGVTSLKLISDLISKNETRPKPVTVTVATDLFNNNVTTTEGSTNITAERSNGVLRFKPTSDLISKNETRPKPVMVIFATDLDNNSIVTTAENNNMTAELSNGVTSLKPLSDLFSKNETRLKPVMVTVGTELGNKNVTTTKGSSNITAETSNAGSSLKSTSDLKSNNETRAKPVMVTIATDLVYKNVTTKDGSSNITAETSNGISSLKPTSDLISKNETRPKSVLVTVAKDLGNKNITTTEESSNITEEISNGVTRLTSISDLVSKNEPSPKSVMATVATNTIDSFHKVNISRTTSTILTDHQALDESNTSLSSIIKIPYNIFKTKHFNKDSVGLISSIDSAISDLPTTLDKPTTLTDKSSGVLDNNKTTHYNDTTKPIINSLYEINKALSYNYTNKDNNNRSSGVYPTTTESERAFNTVESLKGPVVLESSNSMNVTNNTFIVNDMLSEHRAVSDNNKNIANTSKLESKITTKPSSYFDKNKSSIHVISSDTKNVTTLSSQSAKNEMNTKRVIYKNTRDKGKILGESSFVNPNLTKPRPENNLIPKLVTNNNFSLSPAFHITYMNHNITDNNNNSLKDVTNKTVGVINTYLNYPGKNVVPSVSNKSKSVPLFYLNNSLTKLPLIAIYNVSNNYFSKNISQTVNKTTASNRSRDIEDKDSSQTKKSGHVPALTLNIIKHERNKTEYLLLNPYTQVNTPAIKINDTTLKELTYNFSEPSFTVKNNVKHDFIMKNITTSTNKNIAPKGFYNTKDSGYDKSHSTTTIKSVNTNNCTNCSKLSEISNSQLSGNIIKPLLIVKESLQEEKNTSSLLLKNGNLFSKDILNNWGVVNTTLVDNITKRNKTFTHDGNVSEVNSLSFIKTTEKYMNKLNTSSESNSTANLSRNMSSQTNIIKNMTHDGMSSNGLQFSRIPFQFDNSSQSGPVKMEKTPFVLNGTKFEIFDEQEIITIPANTNNSNGIKKKLLINGHGQSESNFTIVSSVTKNIRNNTQNSFITPFNNINYPNKHYGNLPTNQEFRCTKRGKFSDTKDCTKFFVCIGRVQPVIGLCPTDSVFSEYLKQCTKNVTHCIRNIHFKCTEAGRFINILSNNTYFICAKQKSSFIKFTFQCQKSYYLDKNSIKCTKELKNISKSDESSSKNTKELSFDKSKDMEGVSINSKNVFECEKEGKFKDSQDCRKYYVCKKGRKSIYRRKIKNCDSDEVFHKEKKECVDVESYECDI